MSATRAALVGAVLVSIASTAAAQPATTPATTPKAAAQESYAKGQRLANLAEAKHDPALFEAAYLQFAQAYAIYPDDKVLWNLGAAELHTKRFLEALGHFRLYDAHQHVLDHPQHPDNAMLTSLVAQASAVTGHIRIDAPHGTHLAVDGKPVADPAFADVEPGSHTVSGELGPVSRSVAVSCGAGETVSAKLDFDAPPATAVMPSAPPVVPPAAPGADTGATGHSTFFTPLRDVGLVAAGLGAVSLGVAIGFAVQHGADGNNASQAATSLGSSMAACSGPSAPAACATLRSALNAENTDGTMTAAFGIVGGVLAATGVVLIAWPSGSVAPAASPGSVGVRVSGSF